MLLTAVLSTGALAGCGQSGQTIHMATKPMTEQYIMGSMMKTLIEQDTDLTVEVTEGVGGGTANIHPAMEEGEFDFYPEYTGSAWNAVLKEESVYDESMFDQLQAGYDEMDMTWTGMLGFNNTYGLVVDSSIAQQYNLKTYSDLAAVADQLVFGAEYDFFEREDGYDALCDTYGLKFKDTMDLDIGLKYDALSQKEIDVMNIFTTDGQLSAADAVVLEDDKGLYPSYVCGFVVRNEVLEEHPELQQVLDKVPNLLNKKDKKRTAQAVTKWMNIVGLEDSLRGRYPSELSGGQQQRVGIARALAASPDILLMDEPFGAVDEITRGSLQEEISRIHRETGITVLFVTHDIGEALKLGTKVLVMDGGSIQQFAPPREILHAPATDYVRKLVEKERRRCHLPEEKLGDCEYSGAI